MLPFAKNRDDGVAAGPVETKARGHDDSFDLLDAVAEDMLMALERKDKPRLKAALEALISHIQDLDETQDETTMGAP
jgi:hypothetical protein